MAQQNANPFYHRRRINTHANTQNANQDVNQMEIDQIGAPDLRAVLASLLQHGWVIHQFPNGKFVQRGAGAGANANEPPRELLHVWIQDETSGIHIPRSVLQ